MPMLSRCDQKPSKKGFWHHLDSYFPQMTLHWFGDGNVHELQRPPHDRRKDSPIHAHTDNLSCITGDAPWTLIEGRLEMHMATWCKELTHRERPWCWERLRAGGKGAKEDETVGWHHRFNGHEFEQTPGDGEGQGNLACCSPWGHKESDTTYQLNTEMQTTCWFQRC